jgi:hypothetical protein
LIACRSCGVRTIVWPCRSANLTESAIPTASPLPHQNPAFAAARFLR